MTEPRVVFGKHCFGDINISIGPRCREVCEASISKGYKILAINTPVIAKNCLSTARGIGCTKKGRKRKLDERTGGTLSATALQTGYNQTGVPPAKIEDWVNELTEKYKDVRILQRLTIIFSDINHLQAVLSQEHVSTYDILAVVPTNHDALLSCIVSISVTFDIITFDLEGPHWINRIKINKQKGKVAADKEVYFEITYAPSFHGDEPLENMIFLANRLTEDICTRKIKNIVISSGASAPEELRSPKDVQGIGYLLQLDENTTRISTREHIERIVRKADSRKFGKTWVSFVPRPKIEEIKL